MTARAVAKRWPVFAAVAAVLTLVVGLVAGSLVPSPEVEASVSLPVVAACCFGVVFMLVALTVVSRALVPPAAERYLPHSVTFYDDEVHLIAWDGTHERRDWDWVERARATETEIELVFGAGNSLFLAMRNAPYEAVLRSWLKAHGKLA